MAPPEKKSGEKRKREADKENEAKRRQKRIEALERAEEERRRARRAEEGDGRAREVKEVRRGHDEETATENRRAIRLMKRIKERREMLVEELKQDFMDDNLSPESDPYLPDEEVYLCWMGATSDSDVEFTLVDLNRRPDFGESDEEEDDED